MGNLIDTVFDLKITFQYNRKGQIVLEDYYTNSLVYDVASNSFFIDKNQQVPVTPDLIDVTTVKNI